MKTKPKPRARRMFANYYPDGGVGIYRRKRSATYFRGLLGGKPVTVAVIPLHDVDALIEQAYAAFQDGPGVAMKDSMRYALTAIGVLPRARKGRK